MVKPSLGVVVGTAVFAIGALVQAEEDVALVIARRGGSGLGGFLMGAFGVGVSTARDAHQHIASSAIKARPAQPLAQAIKPG